MWSGAMKFETNNQRRRIRVKFLKSEENLCDLWDMIKYMNIRIIGVLEDKSGKRKKFYLKK